MEKRDGEFCSWCGQDCRISFSYWETFKTHYGVTYQKLHRIHHTAEIDHIIPMAEGGLTVVENLRTLCEGCHKWRTAKWHAERTAKKKLASSGQIELITP